MEDADTTTRPSSLPANYVTILELKERWLEKERQQKEKERQQKEKEQRQEEELREEEAAKHPKPNLIAVVPKTVPDFKGRSYRAKYRPANPSVEEAQGVELGEKKAEEPAEEKKGKKKEKTMKIWSQKKKKQIRVGLDMEGKADAPPQASGEGGNNQTKGSEEKRPRIEIRAKSETVGPAVQVGQKFGDLSVNGEAGKGDDDSLMRPSRLVRCGNGEIRARSENVGPAVQVWQKFGDLSVNGEAEKGDDNLRRTSKADRRGNGEIGGYKKFGRPRNGEIRAKSENVSPAVEVVEEFRGLSVSDEAGKGDDNLRRTSKADRRGNGEIGANSENVEVVQKFEGLPVNGEAEKGDGNNSRRRSRVDGRGNGEIRGKSENAGPSVEVVQKFKGLSVDGEAEKEDDNLRRSRVDQRGNGEIGGYRKFGRSDVLKQRGCGMVWVKKGEVADGNGGGVRSSEQGGVASGQTGTSSNAGSLTSAGKMSKNYSTRQWRQNGRDPHWSQ